MDTGYKTPEFWITVVVNIAMSIVAILAARGLLTAEEGELWVQLVQAVAVPVAAIVIGMVTKQYLSGQTQVRTAMLTSAVTRR